MRCLSDENKKCLINEINHAIGPLPENTSAPVFTKNGEAGEDEEPEPQEHVDLLVDDVDRQNALDR